MNLWRQFKKALDRSGPLMIGEVTAVNESFSDQRCTVTLLPGDASIEVIGTGRSLEVGQRWVIQDGKIIDSAPAGEVFNAEV